MKNLSALFLLADKSPFSTYTLQVIIIVACILVLFLTIFLTVSMVRQKRLIKKLKESHESLKESAAHSQESDQLKSAFVANMDHEMRAPLNQIAGFSTLMRDSDSLEERAEYCKAIDEGSRKLIRLVDDILDLSRIESGQFSFNNVEFDLVPAMNRIVNTFRERVHKEHPEKSNIKIVLISPYKRCIVCFDMDRATIVMNNLLNNAIEYTDDGQITIKYKYVNNGVQFEVQDTGIGIPKDKQEVIFGRFVKLNAFSPGSGLGLCIARTIMEAKGGKIWVESEEMNGSRFFVWVPTPAKIS